MRDTLSLEIIDSAARLFDRYGARKTTMEDIAREVGKGKSTLYYYFKSKEEVYENVLKHEFDSFKNGITRKIATESSSPLIMSGFVKQIFEQIHQFPNLKKCLLEQNDGKTKPISLKLKDNFIQWEYAQIYRILEEGIVGNYFRDMSNNELEVNCQAISITMSGLKAILITEEDLKIVNTKIDNLLNLLFNGIRK